MTKKPFWRQSGYGVGFMFGLTLLCAGLVTVVQESRRERIELNRRMKLETVVLRALGLRIPSAADAGVVHQLFENEVTSLEIEGRTVYSAGDADGLVAAGYAFGVSGPGFWGPVSAMVGVDRDLSRITSIEFYRHNETPGLGARITEPWFGQQFAGLALDRSSAGKYFTLTPPAPGKKAPELDAVTGATMTSKAVEAFVNRDLDFLETLRKHLKTAR